ncbi:hypothetical protein DFQ01_1306 [Paenibacillus cellulosilyticus]|uniref:Uncharacterized protein n=1 Tax=Paenibacillus cellulosilyticus TaxID=375489 RepID=A0A2V2YPS2_9BACL|nr:hypothetical protein [Paenibacillus cellulosilyticus]PWV94441.1 hypothetical protein DFQ01_1306 [Paenibacillus cellulosilyticus]QKS44963.1 hypothetical protein HUB94_11485 [Paenibacillus cellulosilyticus]
MKKRPRWLWILVLVCCGLPGVLGLALCTLLLVVGTLFFDDPNASYSKFILTITGCAVVPVLLVLLAIYSYKKIRKENN